MRGRIAIESGAMNLLVELEDFYLEHRRCGELKAGVTADETAWVVFICSCGGQLVRRVQLDTP